MQRITLIRINSNLRAKYPYRFQVGYQPPDRNAYVCASFQVQCPDHQLAAWLDQFLDMEYAYAIVDCNGRWFCLEAPFQIGKVVHDFENYCAATPRSCYRY